MRSIRLSIVYITFMLIMFGMVMVYSSSGVYASEIYGNSFYFLMRHLIAMLAGFMLAFFAMKSDLDFFKRQSKIILLFTMGLLAATLFSSFGRHVAGARRWIELGIINFQPSEIAKITMIIFIADFLSRKNARIKDFWTGYLPPIIAIAAMTLLILLEPDMGTAITVAFVGLAILFSQGARLIHIAMTFIAGMPILYYLILSAPYRKRRLMVFLNPWLDERGSGFQIVQSFLALGSGGLFGVGLGQSKQKLFFLPASHTDFIFAIIGEELGFLGAFSLTLLFFALIWQCMRAGLKTVDTFRKTLILGITYTFAFEIIVNIGVVAGLLPTKGLPLPFLSYGGTSLVMHMVAIGLLLNATRE